MNYLENKRVYLCGAIHSTTDDGISWRESITPRLKLLNLVVSDPCKKTIVNSEIGQDKSTFKSLLINEQFKELKETFWPIVRYDLREVDKCDFVIFNYDTTNKLVGSIHELVTANFEKKVILLKYNKEQLADFNPWIATFIKEHHFFSEWDLLFEHLQNINTGKLDSSYWIL